MKRLAMIFFRLSIAIGVSNIMTPVIIIRLVGRSMRSHAVSTRDIGSRSRRSLGVAWSVIAASSGYGEDGASRQLGRQRFLRVSRVYRLRAFRPCVLPQQPALPD